MQRLENMQQGGFDNNCNNGQGTQNGRANHNAGFSDLAGLWTFRQSNDHPDEGHDVNRHAADNLYRTDRINRGDGNADPPQQCQQRSRSNPGFGQRLGLLPRGWVCHGDSRQKRRKAKGDGKGQITHICDRYGYTDQ